MDKSTAEGEQLRSCRNATFPPSDNHQIWVSCDSTHSGHVSRDGFYRSLALVAVTQQGKDEKSLQQYTGIGEPYHN